MKCYNKKLEVLSLKYIKTKSDTITIKKNIKNIVVLVEIHISQL